MTSKLKHRSFSKIDRSTDSDYLSESKIDETVTEERRDLNPTGQRPGRNPRHVSVIQVLIGSVFMLASIEGLISWLPTQIVPADAKQYLQELTGGGVVKYIVQGVQVVAGALIAFNFMVPLAILLLTPVLINILIYSLVVNPSNLPLALAITAGMLYLVFYYRDIFTVFLKMQMDSNAAPLRKDSDVIILDELAERSPQDAALLREISRRVAP